ncbi:MAG: serpin family protein [Planctomycetota bacterium]|nr:serpin family protein [Planctomycetota bacterium]
MKSCVHLLLFAALLLAPIAPAQGEDVEQDEAATMAAANDRFAWSLYEQLRAEEGNLFVSPYSVHAALAMTREGARGDTAKEMDRVLFLEGVARGAGYQALLEALTPRQVREGFGKDAKQVPAYDIEVANALWGQTGFDFEAPFISALKTDYGAPLARIDFAQSAAARKRINDWVAKKTRDKIQDIVPPDMPDPLTRLVLANAIYLKAPWLHPFKKHLTKEDAFTALDGTTSKADFMRRVGRYRHAELDGVQILELPYRGNQLSMAVFLPRAEDGLATLENRLMKQDLAGWSGKLQSRLVDVRFPKFEFTTSKELTRVLSNLGMPSAFNARTADFSGMTKKERLFIGAVLHKAFVGVDEEGTEAAAATVVIMRKGGRPAQPEKPIVFDADHPFVFVIRHQQTGAILFMGRVTKP